MNGGDHPRGAEALDERAVFERERTLLRDKDGRSFESVRRSWTPNYGRVWLQMGAGAAVVVLTLAILVAGEPGESRWLITMALGGVGGAVLGYALAFLFLWFHEAAHANIHRSRRWNDRLANALLGTLFLQDIRRYRVLHFAHHRDHGAPSDPERSYFQALDLGFLARGLAGVSALRTLRGRQAAVAKESGRYWIVPAVGMALHAMIVVGAAAGGYTAAALAWALGAFSVFPLLASLRQLLEHRRADADDKVDYQRVPHGAYTRTFGDGWFAHTFGAAGFNRHLIHHWDPSLSCTRFRDMEVFLEASSLAGYYGARKTTYARAFKALFRLGAIHRA